MPRLRTARAAGRVGGTSASGCCPLPPAAATGAAAGALLAALEKLPIDELWPRRRRWMASEAGRLGRGEERGVGFVLENACLEALGT